jgi:hypothetical protein
LLTPQQDPYKQECALLEKERIRATNFTAMGDWSVAVSQIASAYIVSSELLDRLNRLALDQDHGGFWDALHTTGEVKPEYSYSGYVLAVVQSFIGDRGVPLPLNLQDVRVKTVFESEYGLMLCAGKADAVSAEAMLDALAPSEQELRMYFEEFNETEWDEAGIAMQEGIRFLRGALAQLHTDGDWLLIFVG